MFNLHRPTQILLLAPLVASAIIAAYTVALQLVPNDIIPRGYGDKDRLIKVENVIYRRSKPKTVIVGSSLAALLSEDVLPDDWANVAVMGGSALSGLEIIERSGLKPQAVVLEMDMMMRPPDDQLLKEVYSQPMHTLRNHVPPLRLRNQPLSLLYGFIEKRKSRLILVRNEKSYTFGLNHFRKAFSTPMPRGLVRSRMDLLRTYLARLTKAGITVYFVRFPLDPQIAGLSQIRAVDKAAKAYFPASRYKWIAVPPDSEFVTTDGIHLDSNGIAQIASILIEKVK